MWDRIVYLVQVFCLKIFSTKGILLKYYIFWEILCFLFGFVFLFCLFLVSFFYFINLIISFKFFRFAKVGSFERGFSSVGKVQSSFRVHFFVIMLIFVVFDVEIVMLLGAIIRSKGALFSFFLVFIFMLGGLYLEWFFNKLNWSL